LKTQLITVYDDLEDKMTEETSSKIKDVDTGKLKALRSLPDNIIEILTKQEIRAFLYEDVWPTSLREKLKNYIEAD
jgi:hypothetical protein